MPSPHLKLSYSASFVASPSVILSGFTVVGSDREVLPSDPRRLYHFVVVVHFDSNVNIYNDMTSLRLSHWLLYLAALSLVSRLHLLTTSMSTICVLSVCWVPDRPRSGVKEFISQAGIILHRIWELVVSVCQGG
jgi:hypothetical protein